MTCLVPTGTPLLRSSRHWLTALVYYTFYFLEFHFTWMAAGWLVGRLARLVPTAGQLVLMSRNLVPHYHNNLAWQTERETEIRLCVSPSRLFCPGTVWKTGKRTPRFSEEPQPPFITRCIECHTLTHAQVLAVAVLSRESYSAAVTCYSVSNRDCAIWWYYKETSLPQGFLTRFPAGSAFFFLFFLSSAGNVIVVKRDEMFLRLSVFCSYRWMVTLQLTVVELLNPFSPSHHIS